MSAPAMHDKVVIPRFYHFFLWGHNDDSRLHCIVRGIAGATVLCGVKLLSAVTTQLMQVHSIPN